MSDRPTMQSIAALVPHGSRVLDLGCGDGAMLDYLQRERGCTGYGLSLIHILTLPTSDLG